MRFLVLGASGMVGHTIGLWLAERGHEVVGLCRRAHGHFPCVEGDVRNEVVLDRLIESGNYQFIINCVALLVDASERDHAGAIWTNAYFPHRLSAMARSHGARVVHISSDSVFNGARGMRRDAELPDAREMYGRSKALGELDNERDLTLRTCPIGPDWREKGQGLFDWFVCQAAEKEAMRGWSQALWTGVTTIELAKIVEVACQEGHRGLIQAVPSDALSKFELLELLNEYIADGRASVVEDGSFAIDRRLAPSDSPLCRLIADYQPQLREMRDWLASHVGLYPKRYEKVLHVY